jgi:hypothetical protein
VQKTVTVGSTLWLECRIGGVLEESARVVLSCQRVFDCYTTTVQCPGRVFFLEGYYHFAFCLIYLLSVLIIIKFSLGLLEKTQIL